MSGSNPTLVFTGPGQVEVEDRPIPTPGPGEVQVRTLRSLISTGTELTLLDGGVPGDSVWERLRAFPRQPGYSNVGVVEAVGAGVDPVWLGQTVHSHAPHQARALAPARKLARVPSGVPWEQATFATLAKVAMNGVRRSGLTWGESAAVLGLGIIGQLAVRFCLLGGARPVFALEPSEERRALLPAHPGVIALPGGDGAAMSALLAAQNGGRKADVAIDLTGAAAVVPEAARLLRTGGRLVIAGSPRGVSSYDFHDLCNRESISIIGAHSAHHPLEETPFSPFTSARHGELFLGLTQAGELDMGPLITHRFSATNASAAYALLRTARHTAMGVILEW